MANDCMFKIRLVSPDRSALVRVKQIMRYKDPELWMYRVREFHPGRIRKRDGYYILDCEGDVAWSDMKWFDPSWVIEWMKNPPKKSEVRGRPTVFPELCRMLDFGVESWTEEWGVGFQGHSMCDHDGRHWVDDERDFDIDEVGDPEPTNPGYGDQYGEFADPETIYRGGEP